MLDTVETLSHISVANTFAILCHRRPDGDAISSSMAMFWYLIDIGKKEDNIDIIIPEFLDDFSFIPGIENVKKSPTKEHYDLIIVVDCADLQFVEGAKLLTYANKVICFDHHETLSLFGNCNIIDISAPSCTCILYRTFCCKTTEFLTCVAVGLISDTSIFTLNVSNSCLEIVKELEESGIDINYLSSKISCQSPRTQKLSKLAIRRGFFYSNSNKIFCTYLLQKDLLEFEKNLNTVNHKAIIKEIQNSIPFTFLILLIENEKGEFKGSLRSLDEKVDLNQICSNLVSQGKLLKGGGHSYSSGCTVLGSYKDINNIFKLLSDSILNY